MISNSIVRLAGMKSFSLSVGKKPAPSRQPRVPASGDFEDESNTAQSTGAQLISAFDGNAGGAIDARVVDGKPIKEPLVILPPQSRDWREGSRGTKRKNLLPEEEQARLTGETETDVKSEGGAANEEETTYGLVVAKKRKLSDGSESKTVEVKPEEDVKEAKTVDEEAMEALLSDGKKKSTLIISAAGNNQDLQPPEEELLRSELAELPDAATVEDYAAVPIEEFGAAILRGQGLREGGMIGRRNQGTSANANAHANSNTGRNAKLLERRPAFLGIGAKNAPKEIAELGAWGKGLKKKVEGYTPIVRRNKRTGEIVTEEEFSKEREGTRSDDLQKSDDRNKDQGRREHGASRRKERDMIHAGRERDVTSTRDRREHGDRDHDRDHDRKRYETEDRSKGDRQRAYERKDRDRKRDRDERRDYDDRHGRRDERDYKDRYKRDERRDHHDRRERDERKDRDRERPKPSRESSSRR